MTAMIKRIVLGSLTLPLILLGQAHAHHPTGGAPPSTLFEGFASGLAHPIIGLEHALFIIAVAVLASLSPRVRAWQWLAFIGMTVVGASLHYIGWHSHVAELGIAASLIVAGVLMLTARAWAAWLTGAFLAVAGLFHGYGYGGAILGSDMGPVLAYLLGFSVIQAAVLLVLSAGLQRMAVRLGRHNATALRAVGLVLAAVGGVLLFA